MSKKYNKIGDYGIIGNGLTTAHISLDGSVDWLCLPYLDSPSVFAALLDSQQGGRFWVRPGSESDSVQNYLERTNVLRTTFRTPEGGFELTDFMPAAAEKDCLVSGDTLLVRKIEGTQGELDIVIELSPRFSYATQHPTWSQVDDKRYVASHGEQHLHFFCSQPISFVDESAVLRISSGQTVWLCTSFGDDSGFPDSHVFERLLQDTVTYWREWCGAQETGKYPTSEFWQHELDRSALVLKLLQFRKTGAIAAAPSCSLPTIVYGERNWDYRYSWVRDTSLTLQALYETGHVKEVKLYLEWLKNILKKHSEVNLEVLYRLRRPEPPDGEEPLEHLHGYKGSRPVLIGQYNVGQHQHDIYGELLDMVFSLSRLVGKVDLELWLYLERIVEHVASIWREKDNGIWELRTGPHNVTHSKVMCWVALDRGIKIAEHYGFPADLNTWKTEREEIHADVLALGYNEKRDRFTQHYDTEALDAALLTIPLVGFLPAKDERVVNTIRAVEKELMFDGLPRRYIVEDGIQGQEHGWLICYFWYLRCLIRLGELERVEEHLRKIDRYANHLGLFGEEFDPGFKEITGNFPQAFSHIGYITTILEYLEARRKPVEATGPSLRRKAQFLFTRCDLTPKVAGGGSAVSPDPGSEIKRLMNILRGQFYDGQRQCIDYPAIRESAFYQSFLSAVAQLPGFNLNQLQSDPAKTAFWINVFNTLLIHGVIELNIATSIKQIPLFFERVTYRIAGEKFALADIEHGILRGNKVPPYRFLKRLRNNDPRLAFRVGNPDARIHFALVCASRTCPPIEVYTEEQLDEQLETSAKVFINATTKLNKKAETIAVSELFKWYRTDFVERERDLFGYVAAYLYNRDNAAWVRSHGERLRLLYTPYDWRLNR